MENFLALERYSFSRGAIERAPLSPGIFGIFDKKELIYVGSTGEGLERTIRECLTRHLDGLYGGCTANATRYCWEITISSRVRARELRSRFEAAHQHPPRCQQSED